jgi:T5SS/PEP-CTERM-associated repeat protein
MHALLRQLRRSSRVTFLLVAVLLASQTASAATVVWNYPGIGDWDQGANWSTGYEPGSSDEALIDNAGTAYLTTTANVSALRLAAGGPSGNFQLRSGGQLNTGLIWVGYAGSGTFLQEAGNVSANGDGLYLGFQSGASGSYTLRSGILNTYNFYVGNSGTGIFTQDAGTVTSPNALILGASVGGNGRYALNGGNVSLNGMTVGLRGLGEFTQADGSVMVSSTAFVGGVAGSLGDYSMTGGAFEAGALTVGNQGLGSFTQEGGVVRLHGPLSLAETSTARGTYTLRGISQLTGATQLVVGKAGTGVLTQEGGTIGVAGPVTVGGLAGALGNYQIKGGTLDATYLFVGDAGYSTGTVDQTGGTVTITGSSSYPIASIGRQSQSVGAYNLSGATSRLQVAGTLAVGESGTGSLVQQGGALSASGSLVVGRNQYSSGTLRLSGGSVSGMALFIGVDGTGVVEQQGGSLSVDDIYVDYGFYGNGTYNLSGGRALAGNDMHLGYAGAGTVSQSGGSMTVGDVLVLGEGSNGRGTYDVSGGSLQAGTVQLGASGTGTLKISGTGSVRTSVMNGPGTLILDGGSLAVTNTFSLGTFILGSQVGTSGGFTNGLNSSIARMYVGDRGEGQYTHMTNSLNIGTELILGNQATGVGTMSLQNGALSASPIVGNYGKGAFTQTGGTVYGPVLLAGKAGSQGSYALSSGAVNAMVIAGSAGEGSFVQTGGTVNGVVLLGQKAGSQGSYALSNGTVSSNGSVVVGSAGEGTFVQTGGGVSLGSSAGLILGELAGGQGSYDYSTPGSGPSSWLGIGQYLVIGKGGTGVFHHRSGNVGSGSVYLGDLIGASGVYQLDSGMIDCGELHVGGSTAGLSASAAGTGAVVQEGGEFHAHGTVFLGSNPISSGSYTLRAGTLNTDYNIAVGYAGTGRFLQTGGAINASSNLTLGVMPTGVGDLLLQSGTIDCSTAALGDQGVGTVTQEGGVFNARTSIYVGNASTSSGSYTLSAGSLKTPELWIGKGDFIQEGGSLSVANYLRLIPGSGHAPYTMTGGSASVGAVEMYGAVGPLAIGGGIFASQSLKIGDSSSDLGEVILSDGGTWSNNSSLVLANSGTAKLRISEGSLMLNSGAMTLAGQTGSRAELAIDGANSRLLVAGNIFASVNGAVSVALSNGAQLAAGRTTSAWGSLPLVFAGASQSTADVTVSGVGSNLASGGTIILADNGAVNLRVLAGGTVNAGNASSGPGWLYMAGTPTSRANVTIDGLGSQVFAREGMRLGYGGYLALNLTGGASVSTAGNLDVAAISTATSTVRIEGAGTRIGGSSIYVGGTSGNSGGAATVELRNGAMMEAGGVLMLYDHGTLLVQDGTLNAGTLVVRQGSPGLTLDDSIATAAADAFVEPGATVVLANSSQLRATNLRNAGTIRGSGAIRATVYNDVSGALRAIGSDYLEIAGNPHTNLGQIQVLGATLDVTGTLTNEVLGRINGHGNLFFRNGLTNRGMMDFAANADLYGMVVNGQTGSLGGNGEIIVSGDASVAFHDPVVHNGTKFQVSDDAHATFFAPVSGAGSFTGGGGIYFERGYNPGNSPAAVTSGVDFTYGPESVSTMELAGLGLGQYDQVDLTGGSLLNLDGTLNVVLLDGFAPTVGSSFDLFRHASGARLGTFAAVNLPTWSTDGYFSLIYRDTAVTLMAMSSAVPEPATLALALLGMGAVMALRRRTERVRPGAAMRAMPSWPRRG